MRRHQGAVRAAQNEIGNYMTALEARRGQFVCAVADRDVAIAEVRGSVRRGTSLFVLLSLGRLLGSGLCLRLLGRQPGLITYRHSIDARSESSR